MILKVRPEAMLEVLEAGTLVREDWEGVVQGVCQVSLKVDAFLNFSRPEIDGIDVENVSFATFSFLLI